MKQLYSLENAMPEVLKELKAIYNYQWDVIRFTNYDRYLMVFSKMFNCAILLKSEPFFNFGKQFKEQGASGVGDSINCIHLSEFLRANIEWIFVKFRDGRLYRISLMDFLAKSYKWQQKEGTWVRSISIHNYERVNKDGSI
jgi:hypothetical protein